MKWMLSITYVNDDDWDQVFFNTKEEAIKWKTKHAADEDIAEIDGPEKI